MILLYKIYELLWIQEQGESHNDSDNPSNWTG